MLEDLYGDDLIGDPQTLEEEEESGGALFTENESNDQNDGDAENEFVSQTLPQSDNIVQPKKKRVVKNPQPKLDAERLKGPRGLSVLESVFADYKFCGKGYEREDLDQVMKRLEHWAHRLFPKYQFDDCLDKIETLGYKKPVMTYIKRIRMGLDTGEFSAVVEDLGTNENYNDNEMELPLDPFDDLISQQLSEVHAAASVNSPWTPVTPSSPLQPPKITLTSEQKERMERNRLIAQDRRRARQKALEQNQVEDSLESSTEKLPTSAPSVTSALSAQPIIDVFKVPSTMPLEMDQDFSSSAQDGLVENIARICQVKDNDIIEIPLSSSTIADEVSIPFVDDQDCSIVNVESVDQVKENEIIEIPLLSSPTIRIEAPVPIVEDSSIVNIERVGQIKDNEIIEIPLLSSPRVGYIASAPVVNGQDDTCIGNSEGLSGHQTESRKKSDEI